MYATKIPRRFELYFMNFSQIEISKINQEIRPTENTNQQISTETAVHPMVNYIEEAMEAKYTVIGAFADIEGAFNNTTKAAIDNALAKYEIPINIRRWIVGVLKP